MVPHLPDQFDRRNERSPGGHGRTSARNRRAEAMTFRATLGKEYLLAASGVPGSLKEAHRVKVGKQIGRLLLSQTGLSDSLLFHRLPHNWSMVPHGACHRQRRKAASKDPSQVRPGFSALAANAVTHDTTLSTKHLGAALAVSRHEFCPQRC